MTMGDTQRGYFLIAAAALVACAATPYAQGVNPHAAAVKAFEDRLGAYMKLREEAASKVPPLESTSDPAKISLRERQLGAAIRQARGQVTPGELFGDDISRFIVHVVRSDWARRSKAERRGLLSEQPEDAPAEANVFYPPNVPLAIFPPNLLAQLPQLPKRLEYRFYGRHLILRDVEANLIVDVLPNVLPM